MKDIHIVGDFTNEKPYMVVELVRGENKYVGHRVLDRFKTEEEAQDKLRDDEN